jgi:thiamine transport system permease protein
MIKSAPFFAILIAALILCPLLATIWFAGGLGTLRASDLSAVRFTVLQAFASAALSILGAIPVARALHRRRFYGRAMLISLLGAPFLLPTIVATLGLIALFGRTGPINTAFSAIGLPEVNIYGVSGVILAHVFFNLPLATRMLLHGWASIPQEHHRLAASLGFDARDRFRHIETPMLKRVLPSAFLAIFLVCLTSFAVALTMGGGPRATTIELAIYQAFRFDFDIARAASLAVLQTVICIIAVSVALRFSRESGGTRGMLRADTSLPVSKYDALVILAASLFLIAPLAMVFARGFLAIPELPPTIWRATGISVGIALASAMLTIALALPLALAQRPWADAAGTLPMTASALVMGTGLFLIARPYVNPTSLALPVTLLTNATLATPFALRILAPEARNLRRDYDRLAMSLGIKGWAYLRLVALPRLRQPLGFCAGLSAAFSMGDLGVITLFSDGRTQTLPLALFQLMGAYRMEQAAAAACLLMGLTFALFVAFERIGHARTR